MHNACSKSNDNSVLYFTYEDDHFNRQSEAISQERNYAGHLQRPRETRLILAILVSTCSAANTT